MQQKKFEEKSQQRWREFDGLLDASEKRSKDSDVSSLPELLQKHSADLSIARHRMYGNQLCEHLNAQVIRGFKLVQKSSGSVIANLLFFFLVKFPQTIRKEWKLHLVCWLICLIPSAIIIWLGKDNPEWVNGILGNEGVEQLEQSFGSSSNLSAGREEGQDFYMFTHYVMNNISIDFQIFATGIIGGIGSLFYLFVNALHFGAAVAYVNGMEDTSKFYGFVSSHAPYELWAMIISGMAGMRVGFALLMPGRMSRVASLKHAGGTAIPLILGAASMTFFAAIIEGFWSANPMTALGGYQFKIWVGIAGWILLIAYFGCCGRRYRKEGDA